MTYEKTNVKSYEKINGKYGMKGGIKFNNNKIFSIDNFQVNNNCFVAIVKEIKYDKQNNQKIIILKNDVLYNIILKLFNELQQTHHRNLDTDLIDEFYT